MWLFFKISHFPRKASLEPFSTQNTISFKPHHFQANFLQNPFKVCISYTILIFFFWIMQNLCLGFWKLGIFKNWVGFLFPVNIFQNLWLGCVPFAICASVLDPCGNLIMHWGIFPYVHAFFITVVHYCMSCVWQIV